MFTNAATDALDAIAAASAIEGATRALGTYLRDSDLHSFTLPLVRQDPTTQDGFAVDWTTNAPDDYVGWYVDCDYVTSDYGLRRAMSSSDQRPFVMGHAYVDRIGDIRESEADFYRRAAHDWGYVSARGIPSRTQMPFAAIDTGMAVWSSLPAAALDACMRERGAEIAYVLAMAQERMRPFLAPSPVGNASLTVREVECLCWLGRGLRAESIADRLCVATVTVRRHLTAARNKLGAATLPEAVGRAVAAGLIAP